MRPEKTANDVRDPREQAAQDIDTSLFQAEMAAAFRPIIAGFLLPCFAYYGVIASVQLVLRPHAYGLWQAALALATAAAALCLHRLLRRGDVGQFGQSMAVLAICGLIYANVTLSLFIEFDPVKLVYFVLLILLVSSAALSHAVIAIVCAVSLSTMFVFAYAAGPLVLFRFAFIGVAAAFASLGLAVLVRGALARAVTARLAAEQMRLRAEIQADRDPLTGLPNRRHFFARLEQSFADGAAGRNVCVGIVDLDGLKPVNDLYGHSVGDQLLIEFAARLRRACPPDCAVARLGGDEFAVALSRPLTQAGLRALGQSICRALREPYLISGIGVSMSASIGFAQFPENGLTVQAIYERADHALHRAKHGSRGEVEIFAPRHEAEMTNAGRIEQALRAADLEAELSVVFQPQHDLMTGRTSGFEALARWNSPSLGPVRPDLFITAAERGGLIEPITAILLKQSLRVAMTWPDDVSLSFNLSALDLISPRSIASIVRIVQESGIDPGRLMFEITETAVMNDFERARGSLQMLDALGCRIALDDFGSGYSSFAYIHRFPLHRIKTDRSFITRLHDDEAVGRNIIRAIADLSANLGVECLAEGVETEDELQVVRASGIRFVQGYYFARPLAAQDLQPFLERPPRRQA